MEKLPYKDFTLKARADDFTAFERKLRNCGGEYIGTDNQKDTYFRTKRGRLKLRQGTLENLITHYERSEENRIEKTIVFRYDLDPTVEEIQSLFYSHEVIGVVEKERKIYYLELVKVHLDTLPDKKMFIEIEAIDRTDSVDIHVLRQQCLAIKDLLGIRDADVVPTGYLPQ
jgi:adenylate cyclase class 2